VAAESRRVGRKNKEGTIIMRPSIKRSLTGFLVAGALGFSAVGADAFGNANGPDAFIGIVGGNPGSSVGGIPYNQGIPYNEGGYQGGGYRANIGPGYQHGYGGYRGYGTHHGGYYHGY
jgi:hypothetical protein